MQQEKNNGELSSKMGITGWLKTKILGKMELPGPVDKRFLEDLGDVEKVGRYEIIEKLGQGSMGVVYHGRDPYIKREVSIKVARPASDVVGKRADKYREMFFIEAQSAGKLMHPNIVAIYDAGMHKDFCYITMEYINGPTLVKYCRKENLLPLNRVCEIIISACKAIDYAHQQGVVHRDIKPSNIMLTEIGEVRITDFGIAHLIDEKTLSKGIVGSPSYMSPEQVKEEPFDIVSDIFSLGCVLYELLTGEPAFPGENYFSIMYKIANTEPLPIGEIRPEIPKIFQTITSKALAKDKDRRYQTGMDFAYDLGVALRGLRGSGEKKGKVEDVIDYVHHVSFFKHFTKEQVSEIMETANVVKVSKGTIMVNEGEIDDSFYIILSGKAAVLKKNQIIAFIERGECFGEMAYLSGDSRTASVIAENDCILLKISALLLDKLPPDIQLLFLKRFAMTLLRRLSVSNGK